MKKDGRPFGTTDYKVRDYYTLGKPEGRFFR